MKLIILNKHNKEEVDYLYSALVKFQKEVYNSGVDIDVDLFIDGHFAIYLVVADDGSFVGFASFMYNNYFSLREPTVGNSYLYVERHARRTKAMLLIGVQAGRVALGMNLPLEHYIAETGGANKFPMRLECKKMYTVYEIGLNEVKREHDRLVSKFKKR